jgi:peptide/nickel transport system substrate-binding protein
MMILLSPIALFQGFVLAQTAEKGPVMDEVRFIHRLDENIALEEVRSGALDMYFWPIPGESANEARNDARLEVYDKTAGSLGLLVNPAPAEDPNIINPFEFREARYALNYLIDREFVINEILKGQGIPLVGPFGTYSPEYLNVIQIVESFGFSYNPSLAASMISDAMNGTGATNQDGQWTFNGNPVTVKILIRQDDVPKQSMGELVAAELEKIGFNVERDYGDLNKANVVVYGSDPKDLPWQIYTEEFAGTMAFVKYDPVSPAQMYAPWFARMPGSLNPTYWNYENATLDEITQRIALFGYTSEDERNQLMRDAVQMGIQESVRIFVGQKTDPFVASANIEGLVNDFGAGITSKFSILNARSADVNNLSLDVGVKEIHQGSWNTIAGLQDLYSRAIYFMVADQGNFRNPYTGEAIPYRTEWTNITTAGPLGIVDVPADAVKWNQTLQQWVEVGEEINATSQVIYKPLYSAWHHGIPMDLSDIMYQDYFAYEWGTDLGPEDRTVDPEYTPLVAEALKLLKGARYVSPDAIETYSDVWHYDEKEIAGAFAFTTEPWELIAASERIIMEGSLAYSRSDAQVKGVGWYDPILREHADMIKAELEEMKNEQFVPPALSEVVTVEDAIARYDASINWIENHGHAIISNGPFYLDNFNVAGGTITIQAFRDSSYPFEVGHWSQYVTPRLADIVSVDIPRTITIGQPTSMMINVEVAGQPSNNATVNYFISDKDGLVVVSGEALAESTGQFNIHLTPNMTSMLSPGPNQIKVFAVSNEALRPDISSNTILAAP